MFFEDDDKILTLRKASSVIRTSITDNEFASLRNQYISLILNSIAATPKDWDKNANVNIKWIGNTLFNRLLEITPESSKENFDDIFALCFRLLQEFYISIIPDLEMDFAAARRFGIDRIEEFTGHAQNHINYAIKELPIALIKNLLNNSDLDAIKNFSATSIKAEELIKNWNREIAEKEERVINLKDKLDNYEAHFNFVGLNEGFRKLATRKEDERKSLLTWLRIFGSLVLLPIIGEILFVYGHIEDIDKVKTVILYSLIPTSSIVLILVYYFRILMFNYKSVISQILQIELRMTLCQFIQSYTAYSGELKANDKDSLAKFENIIFSGIVSDDSKMPSTFDGFENVSSLVKAFKGS